MERTKKSLVFLDTHSVVWLYSALNKKFSASVRKAINTYVPAISPIVKLELQYLREVRRIKDSPEAIIESLSKSIGLDIAETPFQSVIDVANSLDWTRDPFDRIITAEAHVNNAPLITSDKTIRKHYSQSIW